jgi:hypothetical protein
LILARKRNSANVVGLGIIFKMTFEEAVKILPTIKEYFSVFSISEEKITLDGTFTISQLEAMIILFRNRDKIGLLEWQPQKNVSFAKNLKISKTWLNQQELKESFNSYVMIALKMVRVWFQVICWLRLIRSKLMNKNNIELGDIAEDTITKYRGVVVSFTKHITGCDRFTLQSQEIKDGKIPDAYNFDCSTCILIQKGAVKVPEEKKQDIKPEIKAGGPVSKGSRL